jgi:methyltransferase (TIGR00027 family)
MVAAARAMETHRADSLAQDHYARHLVRAAGVCADWPVRIQDVPDGDANPLWGRLGRYFGLRTRVFDDFISRSTHAGASQIVLLGAGLDSRAFRLDLPAHAVLFELDQPDVLAFKHRVFEQLGATPKVSRHAIPVDLRDDWTSALLAAGFDPSRPSTWVVEGVLLYLPSVTERRLIDAVDRLTTPGSTLVYEIKLGPETAAVRHSPIYASAKQQIGIDLIALFPIESRPDSATDLTGRGWSVSVHTAFDFSRQHGRGPLAQPNDALAANRWVFANRPDRRRPEPDSNPPATA